MMFFLHAYLLSNIGLLISYALIRCFYSLAKQKLSFAEILSYARLCLLTAVVGFFLIPYCADYLPSLNNNLPLLLGTHYAAGSNFSSTNQEFATVANIASTSNTLVSGNVILFIGISIFLLLHLWQWLRYLQNSLQLLNLRRNAFCYRRVNKIEILLGEYTIPFCWSWWHKHYIFLPSSLLQNKEEFKLALSHEYQHIRNGDTLWLHGTALLKIFYFYNPFVYALIRLLNELQEFVCDEILIIHGKVKPEAYAQCLLNAVTQSQLVPATLSFHSKPSLLYRRVTMLFNYKWNAQRPHQFLMRAVKALSILVLASSAYAAGANINMPQLKATEIAELIAKSNIDKRFHIAATPPVVRQINRIRTNKEARRAMREALERMKHYQSTIRVHLKSRSLPEELLAIPLIESGYKPLPAHFNRLQAAGIWQIIPSTARNFGLKITSRRDDRLDTQLSTQAALALLNAVHNQFGDWKLAVIAYEYGEANTDKLIRAAKSRDAWKLAEIPAKNQLKEYLALFDAAVIIMHNPSLVQ